MKIRTLSLFIWEGSVILGCLLATVQQWQYAAIAGVIFFVFLIVWSNSKK